MEVKLRVLSRLKEMEMWEVELESLLMNQRSCERMIVEMRDLKLILRDC